MSLYIEQMNSQNLFSLISRDSMKPNVDTGLDTELETTKQSLFTLIRLCY